MIVAGVFGWSPDVWTAIGTIALASVTVLAVLAQEPIRHYFARARLDMEIRVEPPDAHMIQMTHRETGEPLGRTLYVRVRVSHTHGRTAENVELLAARLWRIERASGEKIVVASFLPLSLSWAHIGAATIRIPRKLFRLCDLGHFARVGNTTALYLDTVIQPNPVGSGEFPNILRPGAYELELQLSGDNVQTLSRRWRIEFTGFWSADEATMLSKGVSIAPC